MAKQQPNRPNAPARPQNRPNTTAEVPTRKAAPAPARRVPEKRENVFTTGDRSLIYGRTQFLFMGIGLLLVFAGLFAMMGGAQPDPNQWDPNITYSARRITLAPLLMVAGFVLVGYGIFKKSATTPVSNETTA